jgi:hypothetical protein
MALNGQKSANALAEIQKPAELATWITFEIGMFGGKVSASQFRCLRVFDTRHRCLDTMRRRPLDSDR